MDKDNYIALQKRLGSAYVLGVPAAIFITYCLSIVDFTAMGLRVDPLVGTGFMLTFLFGLLTFINCISFDEVPSKHRRMVFSSDMPPNERYNLTDSKDGVP